MFGEWWWSHPWYPGMGFVDGLVGGFAFGDVAKLNLTHLVIYMYQSMYEVRGEED